MDLEYTQLFKEISKTLKENTNNNNNCIVHNLDNHRCIDNMVDEGYQTLCSFCGQIYNEYYITSVPNIHGLKRRQRLDTIYDALPNYLPQDLKDITINIYKNITHDKIYRNSHKKSIMAACLHRAANIVNYNISLNDLLEIFSIKQNEMNKGFVRLATSLPRESIYTIPFDNDKDERLIILSFLKNIGMEKFTTHTINLFKMVKEKTNLMNDSFCKSVVSGCIYFWIKFHNIPKTMKEVSQKFNISTTTLLSKYLIIYNMVLRIVMKRYFCSLLIHCKQTLHHQKYKQIFKLHQGSLYNPETKLVVYNPYNYDTIKVCFLNSDRNLPIDDVDDMKEWNLILDQTFYGNSSIHFIHLNLTKNTRDYSFNYQKCNEYNNIDANEIFIKEVLSNFE